MQTSKGNSTMKTRWSSALSLFSLLFLCASFAYGQKTDLSLRRALYFTGAKPNKIDVKNDKYVAAGGTITVKKSDAVSCNYESCSFNVGLIAFRDPANGELSTYGEMKKSDGGISGNGIYFADKQKVTQLVVPLMLTPGSKTKVTCLIDPENKTAETDENNNSFIVWITFESYKPE